MHRKTIIAAVLALFACHVPAQGQDLIEMYRSARVQSQAEDLAQRYGGALVPEGPHRLPTTRDSLMYWLDGPEMTSEATLVEESRMFEDAVWISIKRLQQNWFEQKFDSTQWAYLGSYTLEPLDTTYTRVLRAQLEGLFGAPTQRLTDMVAESDLDPEEYVQFEYDLVLNDSIPVRVMDTGGPFNRGVVIATDERYRHALRDIRHALTKELTISGKEASYSDYYYDPELNEWYITGYAGGRYYTDLTSEPVQLIRRRRQAANRQN